MGRLPLVLWMVLAAALALPASAAPPSQTVFYEAVPGTPAGGAEGLADAPFSRRAALTAAVAQEVVPGVVAALGLDPEGVETRATFGGWQLRTNPTLTTTLAAEDDSADRLAAALGWVLRQDSVMVAEIPDAAEGTASYVLLRLPDDTLTPDLGQAFFEMAAAIHKGLGTGYTALGDTLLFLNVRDADGTPYSGMGDTDFAAALATATKHFPMTKPKLYDAGTAEARFVGNDWAADGDGEGYAGRLDPPVVAALRPLRARFDALLQAAAEP